MAKEKAADKLAKPLGDRVLLSELDPREESTTAGGIIIPDSAKSEDVKRARVEAVGIDFFPVAMESFPQGSIEKIFKTLS